MSYHLLVVKFAKNDFLHPIIFLQEWNYFIHSGVKK